MSALYVTIDEVPVTATDHGLTVTTDDDPNQHGLVTFTVEVEYDNSGDWWITQAYRDKKGHQPIVGRYGIEICRFLEGYAEKVIEERLAGQDIYPAYDREPYREAGRTL
jgi:hypothetical protein